MIVLQRDEACRMPRQGAHMSARKKISASPCRDRFWQQTGEGTLWPKGSV